MISNSSPNLKENNLLSPQVRNFSYVIVVVTNATRSSKARSRLTKSIMAKSKVTPVVIRCFEHHADDRTI
ncbi:hypothetical protein TNCV_2850341 [Trichonephila clavipes]|nr:hypothetical protein TNCV_2850341 [Trichonephila clavipes]